MSFVSSDVKEQNALTAPPAGAVESNSQSAKESRESPAPPPKKKKKHRWLRRIGWFFLILIVLVIVARPMMPRFVRWYVIRTIDRNPLYEARIGDIDIHLYRGAYTINDIRLLKTTGNIPVPFVSVKHLDLAIEWKSLLHGKVVGRIELDEPQVNFVASKDDSTSQAGGDEPWLAIVRDLFPFKINSAIVKDASIHFRTYDADTPVDVYLSDLQATCDDLTNVQDATTPLVSTISAKGTAMDQAEFNFQMKLDPFSYKPTFQVKLRLLGLDVTKTNLLVKKYGGFDFERGWFDLVMEANSREGEVDGYVKPLFRNLQVLGPADVKKDNPLELFWEAVVGVTTQIFKNAPRDQLATVVPFTGNLDTPELDYLTTLGNVLRNAFVRAYLPRFQGTTDGNSLQFAQGSVIQDLSAGNDVAQ